jgi:hypothetical protein
MILQTYRCAAALLNMAIDDLKATVKRNATLLFQQL